MNKLHKAQCPICGSDEPYTGTRGSNDSQALCNQKPAQSDVLDRHVGDSRFESWFAEYNSSVNGTKQQMRDAYAAGMGDTMPPDAQQVNIEVAS